MELLAPAGSISALKAAVSNGADAVYLGLDLFNARAKAENFTIENIKEHIDFCHLYGVKVYIAFNTCIKENELISLKNYVKAAAEAGADAFIVTDIGALGIFRGSGVPLHASTQMGIHNYEGALMAKKLGFTRVVLARECTVEDIKAVKKAGLEVEVFVHGALCVCFSGGCLMSSFMSGDSGNRGRCNQPCRLKYSCNGKSGYLLSAADLNMLGRIKELRAAGADSLKVEGRLKTDYYCGEVISAYRAAIDGKLKGDENSRLLRAFNRGGFTKGYGVDDTNKLISAKIQNNTGEESGEVKVCGRGYIDVAASRDISPGDGLKLTRGGFEVCGFTADKTERRGMILRISCKSEGINPGDKVFVTYDKSRAEELALVKRRIPVRFTLSASVGGNAVLTAAANGESVTVTGGICGQAKTDGSRAAEQVLNKSQGEFVTEKAEVNMQNAFIPSSLLNGMRREALNLIRDKLLNKYNREKLVRISSYKPCEWEEENRFNTLSSNKYVIVSSVEGMAAAKSYGYSAILQISDYKSKNLDIIMKSNIFDNNIGNILAIPLILRSQDMKVMRNFLDKYAEKFEGFYCENLGAIELALEYGKKIIGGIGLNIYNSNCIKFLPLDDYAASVELTEKEVLTLPSPVVYAYGRVRLMTLSHCPVKLNYGGDCSACRYKGEMEYRDRFGAYPVRRTRVASCYFSLHNPALTDITSKLKCDVFGGKILLDMVNYSVEDIKRTLARYNNGGAGGSGVTCGHLFRGVK